MNPSQLIAQYLIIGSQITIIAIIDYWSSEVSNELAIVNCICLYGMPSTSQCGLCKK